MDICEVHDIISLSQYLGIQLRKGVSPEDIDMVLNDIDISAFSPSNNELDHIFEYSLKLLSPLQYLKKSTKFLNAVYKLRINICSEISKIAIPYFPPETLIRSLTPKRTQYGFLSSISYHPIYGGRIPQLPNWELLWLLKANELKASCNCFLEFLCNIHKKFGDLWVTNLYDLRGSHRTYEFQPYMLGIGREISIKMYDSHSAKMRDVSIGLKEHDLLFPWFGKQGEEYIFGGTLVPSDRYKPITPTW